MTEVDDTCSKQQSDAGSEANCPNDEGGGRVESETREPVADASEGGRSLQCRETGKCCNRRSVIASHWSTNQGRPYNNHPLFRASHGLCQQLSISGACGKEVTSKRRIKFSGFFYDLGHRMLMSVLGQKQTYALQKAMSSLAPIAMSIAFFGMSALGQ